MLRWQHRCVKVWSGDLPLPAAFPLPHQTISLSQELSTNQKQVNDCHNRHFFSDIMMNRSVIVFKKQYFLIFTDSPHDQLANPIAGPRPSSWLRPCHNGPYDHPHDRHHDGPHYRNDNWPKLLCRGSLAFWRWVGGSSKSEMGFTFSHFPLTPSTQHKPMQFSQSKAAEWEFAPKSCWRQNSI